MRITLNNREEQIDKEVMTVQELIDYKNFSFKLLVTKVNGKLVKKDQRDRVIIRDGDKVTVLHLVSGG
ncbi:MAG: sulfur carrier protein ThiS [Bacteroidales bacterium]|nr:sulfur carrier protein ThiS [Bacteroidales bacterium]MCF8344245.1 sulfur carrier protein ThiS [Bacteroidales bacterium]MCF8350705.1 sulfur carrier protein ThiS [Bacteroidales bacterium]MCF8377516.1 sulfur carrier protein ThiS [Bacteroidales bacterium]MCF8401817.1 sulfur carrier protein ThiS [Bacteroidales bacterium]